MDFEFDDETYTEETAKLDEKLGTELSENIKYSNALDNLLHCAKFEKLYNKFFKKPIKNSMDFLMHQSSLQFVHAYSDKVLENFGFKGYRDFIESQVSYILLADARKMMTQDGLSMDEALEASLSRTLDDSEFTVEIVSIMSEYSKYIVSKFVDYGMDLIEERNKNRDTGLDNSIRS